VRRDDPLLDGTLRHVCVDASTWRKTDVPDWIRSGRERFSV
jgi:acyl-CoA thioesterase FadM